MNALLRFSIWMTVTATVAFAENKPSAGPTFEQLIFDKADFIRRLPENTLLWPDPATLPKSPPTFAVVESALKELGDVPGVQFIHAPKEVSLPIIARFTLPEYPESMLKTGEPGEAKFLVLINSAGGVGAIYCFQSTNKAFALAGAQSVVQWTYHPALYGKTKVSILTVIRVGSPRMEK